MEEGSLRPGLAKVSSPPLLRRRTAVLVSSCDGVWRELFDHADVVSEGATRQEKDGDVYYGTTSLVLGAGAVRSWRGTPEELAVLLAHDPHLRLRALRVALREASARAVARLDSVRAEVSVRPSPEGVVVSVDVTARVFGHDQNPLFAGGSRSR